MAKSPDDQQKTDDGRIGRGGRGKMDPGGVPRAAEPVHAESAREGRDRGSPPDTARLAAARERIESERQAAIEQLRTLGISPDLADTTSRPGTDVVLDEGDAAQASERQDMNFMTRQRLAERINRLTAALERIQQGRYGICSVCGGAIEPGRLAAIPDSDVCLQCQERRERGAVPEAAA